ncbi:hypothetical protein GWK47_021495 [Chionoecetes opilio]|uniref:Uncharacterized protein n=1 Tax=Chionoecetes opilio TaxID=41210 RepID=A0A8J4XNP6_CHIOP|nr:hypothetical protein GWK47_021495 [Chionoecetes opilio]
MKTGGDIIFVRKGVPLLYTGRADDDEYLLHYLITNPESSVHILADENFEHTESWGCPGAVTGVLVTCGAVTGVLMTCGAVMGMLVTCGAVTGVLVTCGTVTGVLVTCGAVTGVLVTCGAITGVLVTYGAVTGVLVTCAAVMGVLVTCGAFTGVLGTCGAVTGVLVTCGPVTGVLVTCGTVTGVLVTSKCCCGRGASLSLTTTTKTRRHVRDNIPYTTGFKVHILYWAYKTTLNFRGYFLRFRQGHLYRYMHPVVDASTLQSFAIDGFRNARVENVPRPISAFDDFTEWCADWLRENPEKAYLGFGVLVVMVLGLLVFCVWSRAQAAAAATKNLSKKKK